MPIIRLVPRLLVAALPLLLAACAHSPIDDPDDPLEPLNRATYAFNTQLDHYIARPAAKGYRAALPKEIQDGFRNFFDNLTYPTVIINDALQGKLSQSGWDTTRFLMNTTFGLAGFLDPASMVGLDKHDEDFGQTLGYWGVGAGWYLMIPLLGPSTNRDLVGRIGNTLTNPLIFAPASVSIPTTGLSFVQTRAQLLGVDSIIDQQFDPYVFVRSAYLQHRENLIYDGHPPKEDYDTGD
ncbi:MAG: MlaA family lipoprotein [Stenotrophobium sp.]